MGRRGAAARFLERFLERLLERFLAPSLALVLACAQPAQAMPDCPPSTASLAELGRDYRAQRAQRGHFDGAARNAAVDDYGAARHCLMEAVRKALQRDPPSQRVLHLALGAPDHAWHASQHPGQPLPAGWRPRPGDRLQWYRWRGERDGLLIWLRQSRVLDSGWSMSHE